MTEEIAVLFKYLSSFWRTLEMLLINCETNFILTWSADCVITNSTGAKTFEITDTNILKIMQNCYNNLNQDLNAQLFGIDH